jgi:esterase/lipase superfamily enzyme
MKREYRKWFSPNLQRNMELLVFGHAGEPVIFFPTRTARFYDYEDWRIIEAIRYKIEAGFIQVFCVDSVDSESFYASIHPANKIKRHLQYEQYILQEVLPLIRYFNPQHTGIATAGCSLGGYHALNIAFRHPWLFSKVTGMSSRYDLTLSADKFPDLLNGYFDENVYYNMPSMYMPNLTNSLLLDQIRRLKIELAVGREDPFYENNQRLSDALTHKNIPHHLYVWDEEAHRPRYWRQMVQWYL